MRVESPIAIPPAAQTPGMQCVPLAKSRASGPSVSSIPDGPSTAAAAASRFLRSASSRWAFSMTPASCDAITRSACMSFAVK